MTVASASNSRLRRSSVVPPGGPGAPRASGDGAARGPLGQEGGSWMRSMNDGHTQTHNMFFQLLCSKDLLRPMHFRAIR